MDWVAITKGIETSERFRNLTAGALRNRGDRDSLDTTESVPASNRAVSLNHNSAQYKETMEALDKVEESVRGSNEYNDDEDKKLRLAEMGAGKELLKSTSVRPAAVRAVLAGTLIYLAEKFANAPIGEAALLAWNLVKSLIGL